MNKFIAGFQTHVKDKVDEIEIEPGDDRITIDEVQPRHYALKLEEEVPVVSGSGDSTAGSFPCKITGGGDGGIYTADYYENGKNQSSTGSGSIFVLDLHIQERVPSGTWVVGHPTTTEVLGQG